MTDAKSASSRAAPPRRPAFVRVVRARPRLFLSALLGIAVTGLLSILTAWKMPTRLVIGWDVGIGLYLILAAEMMARSDVRHIRRRAAVQDDSRLVMLVLTATAGVASLAAIVAELGTTQGTARSPAQLAIAMVTILLSWTFIHSMFALHYAHEYYADRKGTGMAFPGDEDPDYWDFVYFSVVIGMTSQVSDVAVTSKSIRNTVAAHGVVSFFFNVTLLALMVNIAASAL
jgi:uncharacterized membrane protein